MNKNHFDPHTSFIDLPIFRKTIALSLLLTAIVCVLITINSKLESNFTFEGFNQALTIFKFPLGILAITIPIIALLAANHRSEQTKEQMRLAAENNNFSNYFKHFSEFQSYSEKRKKPTKSVIITNTRNLHIKLFPESKNGIYQASKQIIAELDDILTLYLAMIENTSALNATYNTLNSSNEISDKEKKLISTQIFEDIEKLTITANNYFSSLSLSQDEDENDKLLPIKVNINPELRFFTIKYSVMIISQSLGFDEQYEPSEAIKLLAHFTRNDKMPTNNEIEKEFLSYYKKTLNTYLPERKSPNN